MHDIEPFYRWRERYTSEEDDRSPFYGRVYSEFTYTNKVYNYFLHPQWDDFGSQTLYAKQIWTDYDRGYAIVELIGEWNDVLYNDVKFLKEELVDPLLAEGVTRFIFSCENVLNFHGDDDCYYEEWAEEAGEAGGWIALVNTLPHVEEGLRETMLDRHLHFGGALAELAWRPKKPRDVLDAVEDVLARTPARLG